MPARTTARDALSITDVSRAATVGTTAFIPGPTLRLRMTSAAADGSDKNPVFLSSPVEIKVDNEIGRLGGRDTLDNGVLIGPGRIACPSVASSSQSRPAAAVTRLSISSTGKVV